ncbi:MAG: hypothetical protein JWO87_3054 [Phycisphaerales bacterium]|jgi:hypothetical protein|nr:hypothetical protein [Phycisphaerales bacterium]
MPVRQYTPTHTPDHARLVDLLADEWRAPNAAAQEPVILEEPNSKGEIVHIYVVWSDWAHLSRDKRGEIIMDAAERVKPLPEVLGITIAMGLTPDEADQFGLKWR